MPAMAPGSLGFTRADQGSARAVQRKTDGGGTLPMATSAALGRGAFSFYRSQLTGQTTLSPQQEHDLATRWRAGDRSAGRKMIEACLPFVMTIALEYRRWGIQLDDKDKLSLYRIGRCTLAW